MYTYIHIYMFLMSMRLLCSVDSSLSLFSEPETVIQVLTTGFWPSCPPTDRLILPPCLAPPMSRFEDYYRGKYGGRRLVWAHALGRCIVVARFNGGAVKKELEVSFFQVLILEGAVYIRLCNDAPYNIINVSGVGVAVFQGI
jgi:Cullin family